jgi:hypothetical protein
MKLEIYGGPKDGGWIGHGEYEPGIDPRLDACPFCDSDDIEVSNTHTPYYHATCNECGTEGPFNRGAAAVWRRSMSKRDVTVLHQRSFAKAINDWNTRP